MNLHQKLLIGLLACAEDKQCINPAKTGVYGCDRSEWLRGCHLLFKNESRKNHLLNCKPARPVKPLR
jgi:hypothetical protein